MSETAPLILASTSRYRAGLLTRLQLAFTQQAPGVDETPAPRETAQRLAARLAAEKARAVAAHQMDAWVIGSDQSAACEGQLLGKPGSLDAAREQLSRLAGRYAIFATAVQLVRQPASGPLQTLRALDVTVVKLRRLRSVEIERYLAAEPALDCAGSFQCEGLGISLFEEIQTRDPTALVGLPLIATSRLLRKAGYALP